MTQVELKPGTYTLNPETTEDFHKVVCAFKAAGFPEGNRVEDPALYPLRDYLGWAPNTQSLELWNAPEHYGEEGVRNFLTLGEILSTLEDSEAKKKLLLQPGTYTDTPSNLEDFTKLVQLFKDAGFPEDGIVENYHEHRRANYFGWHSIHASLQFWVAPEFFGEPDQRTYIPLTGLLPSPPEEEWKEGKAGEMEPEADTSPSLHEGTYTDAPTSESRHNELVRAFKAAGFSGTVDPFEYSAGETYFGWDDLNELCFWNNPATYGDVNHYLTHEQILGNSNVVKLDGSDSSLGVTGTRPTSATTDDPDCEDMGEALAGYPRVGTTCRLLINDGTHRYRILAYAQVEDEIAVMTHRLDTEGGLESYICESITFLPDEVPSEKWVREAQEQAGITSSQAAVLYSNMVDGYLEIPNPAED